MTNNRMNPRPGVREPGKPKKKRLPIWKIIYWSVILLLILTVVIVVARTLGKITDFLTEYEEVQPKHLAEEVFRKYFSPFNYDSLRAESDEEKKLTEFESEEDIKAYINALIDGKELSYHPTSVGTSGTAPAALKLKDPSQYFIDTFNAKGTLRYAVKAGESKIAEFTLDHSEDPSDISPRGFVRYRLSGISVYYYPHESISVKIPETFTAYLNGKPIGESHKLADVRETTEHENHLPDGVAGITYIAYTVKGLYKKPELTIVSNMGESCTPVYNEEGNYYTCDIYSEKLKNEYSDYVIKAVEGYCAYIQETTVKTSEIQGYFDTSTKLWKSIMDNPYYFVIDHSGWFFVNQTASEFYRYSDSLFSCRVSLDHHLTIPGKEDYVDHVDLTLYLRRDQDGVYRIYDTFANAG